MAQVRAKELRMKPVLAQWTGSDEVQVRGLAAPVEVRRHPAARRLSLRISRTRRAVIVTMPPRCRREEATAFLEDHLDWVRERLAGLPAPIPFDDGAVFPLRGDLHQVHFTGTCRRASGHGVVRAVAPANEGALPLLEVYGQSEHRPRRLRDWLVSQAKLDLDERVTWHARNLGVRPKRITVRDQTTRWGSCSSSGALSFSWRLILAPPLVLDYVAAHEVAHLEEMNHGPRFWQLVELTMPRLEEAKHWLCHEGLDLHRYGA
ncbi:MAG: SprT family zinc-dependent metalloprotease [Pseudomonadota bacterium]